jgi:hypothetical protein
VPFVGVLKVGGDGLIERLFLHGATWGRVFSLLLTGVSRGGRPPSVSTFVANPPIRLFLS